jgi:hypothetical protein
MGRYCVLDRDEQLLEWDKSATGSRRRVSSHGRESSVFFSNHELSFMREELKRHASQGTRVMAKEGSEETSSVNGVDLDKTDVGVAGRSQ